MFFAGVILLSTEKTRTQNEPICTGLEDCVSSRETSPEIKNVRKNWPLNGQNIFLNTAELERLRVNSKSEVDNGENTNN